MGEFTGAIASIPADLRTVLAQVPTEIQETVQEIRLRAGAPVVLSTPQTQWFVKTDGQVTTIAGNHLMRCSTAQLTDCFQMLCEYSVHTHQQELRNGYISTRSGCRIGVAGSAVVENGEIVSMRAITSLCIRVARAHIGCARLLARQLTADGGIPSTLLCGEPSSGKSSLLRDLARQLVEGSGGRRWRVAVVDERGELSGEGQLCGCDVLLYCPKVKGIEQAVRCLAPDVVLFDELGTEEELRAVAGSLQCGVAVIASAHCRDTASLLRRPGMADALHNQAFTRIALLAGREAPGTVARLWTVEELLRESSGIDFGRDHGRTAGRLRLGGLEPTG